MAFSTQIFTGICFSDSEQIHVRSLVNPLKFSLANFATNNATSIHFPLFWKAIGTLEENYKLKVVGVTCDGVTCDGVTCDGASPNRRMFRMHLGMTRHEDINEGVDVTYRTRNAFAEVEERYIYFFIVSSYLLLVAH